MSCYNWERGTIKIPSSEWAGLKAAVRTQFNQKQDMGYQLSILLYHHLKKALKGKRNQSELLDPSRSILQGRLYESGFTVEPEALQEKGFPAHLYRGPRVRPESSDEQYDFWHQVYRSVVVKKDGKWVIRKPQKKHWPAATNKTRRFEATCEADIVFSDDKTKTVLWCVSENNRAVETARDSSLGKALFHALGKITWTRGSGCKIVGNDEYNRDDEYEGGGANYVTEEYRFKSSKELEQERQRALAYRRTSFRRF